jgi:cold shock protein
VRPLTLTPEVGLSQPLCGRGIVFLPPAATVVVVGAVPAYQVGVVVVAVGKILRFDDVRGYGFIASATGGEDVFVHANDFGEQRYLVHPGMPVEYEVEEGERGLKVSMVRIVDGRLPTRTDRPSANGESHAKATPVGDDDGLCDVLAPRALTSEVTEMLVQQVPSLTADQIAQVRQHMVNLARSHGWVEA